jgi:phosphoesterase RecJ-like protein
LRPDLFILVDAMNFQRVSRVDGDDLKRLIKDELRAKLAILDHHTQVGLESSDVYINSGLPATAQEVYRVLFKELNMKKPDGYAQTTLLGIVSDTSRFKYKNPAHRQTFEVVSELLEAGASIEALEYRLDRYTTQQMAAFSVLARNLTDSGEGYTFSYIDTPDIDVNDTESVKVACEIFTDRYIRNIDDNYWGFIVYPEDINGRPAYSVSFRSINDLKDVSAIAERLGGGGHKAAAGAKGIGASSAAEAVKKVQALIDSWLSR